MVAAQTRPAVVAREAAAAECDGGGGMVETWQPATILFDNYKEGNDVRTQRLDDVTSKLPAK